MKTESPVRDTGYGNTVRKQIQKEDGRKKRGKAGRKKKVNIEDTRLKVADWRCTLHDGMIK